MLQARFSEKHTLPTYDGAGPTDVYIRVRMAYYGVNPSRRVEIKGVLSGTNVARQPAEINDVGRHVRIVSHMCVWLGTAGGHRICSKRLAHLKPDRRNRGLPSFADSVFTAAPVQGN